MGKDWTIDSLAKRTARDVVGLTGVDAEERAAAIIATSLETVQREMRREFYEGHESWCERGECSCGKDSDK